MGAKTVEAIQDWLTGYVAELLDVPRDEVDARTPFDRLGLDSAAAVGLAGDLERWLGRELDPTLLYDHETIEALARHLVEGAS